MKSFAVFMAVLLLTVSSASAALPESNKEYYIWLNIYEKLLGFNEDDNSPAISAFGVKLPESYVFVAENSGKDGYVLLRHKRSGWYLAASSSSSYSVVFEQAKSSDDRFCWKTDVGTYSYLINKKNGKYLGVDGANKGKDYVSVYYDKPKGSHSQFSVIPVEGTTWDEARAAWVSNVYTNAQGVREIDYCLVKDMVIDRDDAVDIHITANTTPISGSSKINLGSDRTWLIIDNIPPSQVISSYLKYVTINGKAARNGSNCRVAVFLNGAVIIPTPASPMTCQGTNGEFQLSAGTHTSLGTNSNTMTSFVLRRGYMATVASGNTYGGHSRVYVADHADLSVTLPTALAKRVSSVYVKPWPYLSKKGWGDTGGATKGPQLRANWFWSWSAGYSSTNDMEYVPCRQHRYWPSASDVNNKTATAAFSINEPEHPEQHTSDKCSCGGTIDVWTAYTYSDDFKAGAGRIGSPQPTDLSYLTQFCQHVDNNARRCDFTVTHAYWDIEGRSESSYASWFADRCKSVWNNTGRPLWITELEIGSSWGESWDKYSDKYGTYRKYLQVLLQKMEECPWIERYCIYSFDNYWAWMFYKDGSITPAGQVYRDHRSTFAYDSKYTKTPSWWAPSAKTPALETRYNEVDQTISFVITNPNTDMTDQLIIERQNDDGSWETFAEVTDRWKFENEKFNIPAMEAKGVDINQDLFRVTVVTLTGKTVSSSSASSGYIKNPLIETDSKDAVDKWTCVKEAQNGYTKATGDTYLEVWDPNPAIINFNYYQDVEELPDGIYRLQANVFNSSNDVEGALVNDAVGLYAQTADQFYFCPVKKDSKMEDADMLTIDSIIVDGGTLRVGVRNLGQMSARWAGADNFQLIRLSDINDAEVQQRKTINDRKLTQLMPEIESTPDDTDVKADIMRDATRFIINPECNNKSSYGWTVSNIDYDTANPYMTSATNPYWNKWKSGAFSSQLKQEITGLPSGEYSLSALFRAQDTANIKLTIAVGEEQVQSADFKGKGAVATETDQFPSGWNQVTTPTVELTHGQTLTISMDMSSAATAWWSADHFQLIYHENSTPVAVESIEMDKNAELLQENGDGAVYDIAGRRVEGNLKPGIYIRNGRKFLKR